MVDGADGGIELAHDSAKADALARGEDAMDIDGEDDKKSKNKKDDYLSANTEFVRVVQTV